MRTAQSRANTEFTESLVTDNGETPEVKLTLNEEALDRGYRIGEIPLTLEKLAEVSYGCVIQPIGILLNEDDKKSFLVRYPKHMAHESFVEERAYAALRLRQKLNGIITALEMGRQESLDLAPRREIFRLSEERLDRDEHFPVLGEDGTPGLTKDCISRAVNTVRRASIVEIHPDHLVVSWIGVSDESRHDCVFFARTTLGTEHTFESGKPSSN